MNFALDAHLQKLKLSALVVDFISIGTSPPHTIILCTFCSSSAKRIQLIRLGLPNIFID